jgi:hypothetical protein
MPLRLPLPTVLFLAGVGQIVLALGSLAIPRVLHWKEETARLSSLTRQVFWTYAAYIWATNLCFGFLSLACPGSLLDRSALAGAVSTFIAVYWGARLLIQVFFFHWVEIPRGLKFLVAEAALTGLFLFLVLAYGSAAFFNIGGMAP